MIRDLSGSWCIRETDESTLIMDSPAPLMHHDPDRSWITDPDPDLPEGTLPLRLRTKCTGCCVSKAVKQGCF